MISAKILGEIADEMYEWEGRIADELGLSQPEVAAIKEDEKKFNLQK